MQLVWSSAGHMANTTTPLTEIQDTSPAQDTQGVEMEAAGLPLPSP